jgi:hypothetical protein
MSLIKEKRQADTPDGHYQGTGVDAGNQCREERPILRQLAERHHAGLTVTLEWNPDTDDVQIRCEDERSPDHPPLCFKVAPGDALRAFLHPFAYA